MSYQVIRTETRGRIGIITLNRPEALNALNSALIDELVEATRSFDVNPQIGAIVLTGSPRAFAAGADIKQMSEQSYMEAYLGVLPALGGSQRLTRAVGKALAMLAKEAVNHAFETTLSSGLRFERRVFHSLFATNGQKEGMRAFIGKREPHFTTN